MKVAIEVQAFRLVTLLMIAPTLLFVGIVWKADTLIATGYVEVLLILIAVVVVFFLTVLFVVQASVDIGKKAIDWSVEIAKKEVEDARRKEEDAKCEKADAKRREYEIKLAEIASTIKVEVSDVRLLRS